MARLIKKEGDSFVVEFTRKELATIERALDVMNSLHLDTLNKLTALYALDTKNTVKGVLDTQLEYFKENSQLADYITAILNEEGGDSDGLGNNERGC